jgi:hypothetical protein
MATRKFSCANNDWTAGSDLHITKIYGDNSSSIRFVRDNIISQMDRNTANKTSKISNNKASTHSLYLRTESRISSFASNFRMLASRRFARNTPVDCEWHVALKQ